MWKTVQNQKNSIIALNSTFFLTVIGGSSAYLWEINATTHSM